MHLWYRDFFSLFINKYHIPSGSNVVVDDLSINWKCEIEDVHRL